MEFFEDGRAVTREVPMRNAMNEVLRDWYVGDCAAGVERWNRVLERYGVPDRLRVPDRKFNRGIGMYSGLRFDPHGRLLTSEQWERRRFEWLPSPADSEYLAEHHGEAGVRAREVRELHRAAAPRHQPAACRFRGREDGTVALSSLTAHNHRISERRSARAGSS